MYYCIILSPFKRLSIERWTDRQAAVLKFNDITLLRCYFERTSTFYKWIKKHLKTTKGICCSETFKSSALVFRESIETGSRFFVYFGIKRIYSR